MQAYDDLRAHFPDEGNAHQVVVRADDVRAPEMVAAIRSSSRGPGVGRVRGRRGAGRRRVGRRHGRARSTSPTPGRPTARRPAAASTCCATTSSRPRSAACRRRGRGRRRHRVRPRLQRPARPAAADRLRVRAAPDARPAAADVPQPRGGAHGDRAQRPVRARRVRPAGARLPALLGRRPARVRVQRRDRRVAAAVPVRHPVRALDGLPRVRPEPHPRGRRPRHDHRGRRELGHPQLRRRRHLGGARDDGRVRDLRHPDHARHEAARRRARRRGADRRHDRARRAAARDDARCSATATGTCRARCAGCPPSRTRRRPPRRRPPRATEPPATGPRRPPTRWVARPRAAASRSARYRVAPRPGRASSARPAAPHARRAATRRSAGAPRRAASPGPRTPAPS